MATNQTAPDNKIPDLLTFERFLLVAVIAGAFGVGALGLIASFDTVGQAAQQWGFRPSWILPVAIDTAIPVFSLAHLLLIRADMPMTGVRAIPWVLTGITVYLNVASAGGSLAAQLGHGALPLLWVACSEIAAHVYRALIGAVTGRRMERVRKSRWMLAPVSTALLWRRMILWEETSYRAALLRERDRVLARADLRETYGRRWRQKAPRRQRTLLRIGELAPVQVLAVPAARTAVPPELAEAAPILATETTRVTGDSTALTSAKSAPTSGYVAGGLYRLPTSPEQDAAGDSTAEDPGDSSEAVFLANRQDRGDSPEAGDDLSVTGGTETREASPAGDNLATAGDSDNTGRHRKSDRKRRSMDEWVELAGPIFHAEFKRLRRQPTGEEFAQFIADAGLGSVSASTAKNIRTAVVDATALPVLT